MAKRFRVPSIPNLSEKQEDGSLARFISGFTKTLHLRSTYEYFLRQLNVSISIRNNNSVEFSRRCSKADGFMYVDTPACEINYHKLWIFIRWTKLTRTAILQRRNVLQIQIWTGCPHPPLPRRHTNRGEICAHPILPVGRCPD